MGKRKACWTGNTDPWYILFLSHLQKQDDEMRKFVFETGRAEKNDRERPWIPSDP